MEELESIGPRKHRPFTAVSGLLLFLCLFLPAVRACGTPTYPYEIPAFTPPYVLGLVFALTALARTRRGIGIGLGALRIALGVMLLGGAVMLTRSTLVGFILMGLALLLIGTLAGKAPPERRIALVSITANVLWAVWFVLWCTDSGAMIGVYASLIGSLGLIVGGVMWLDDIALSLARPDLARATVISSGP